jgi:photosystem II stability/assembly factor-like uncharacterized protein
MSRARGHGGRIPRVSSVAAVLLAGVIVTVAGCASSAKSALPLAEPAAPGAASPWLLMVTGQSGYAVWRSGSSSILMHTDDNWKDAENLTPLAVPTGGGLSLALGPGKLAIGVAPVGRLTNSPLLTSSDGGHTWTPNELPGALSGSRHSVAFAGSILTAVVASNRGTLVEQTLTGWRTLTDAGLVRAAAGLEIDSIVWASARVGWLTGRNARGASGSPVVFMTIDAGATWSPVNAAAAAAALAPCGAGSSWQLPVVGADLTFRILRTNDRGQTWTVGVSQPVRSQSPTWACRGAESWLILRSGDLAVSRDAGASWRAVGPAPASITDLAPDGSGHGLAAANNKSRAAMYSVTDGGPHFAEIGLPTWVAKLAPQQGSD